MADEKTSLFRGLTASDTTLLVIGTVIGTALKQHISLLTRLDVEASFTTLILC